jgi:flagellar assembly factor FliW
MGKWIEERGVIDCPNGLLGFPHAKRFIILEESEGHEPVFRWLQSVDDPDVAFVVADPDLFAENYWENIPIGDRHESDFKGYESPIFLVIVTVPAGDPFKMTANLLAPLVLSPITKTIRQVVLSHSDYVSCYPIFEKVRSALVGASE